MLLFSTEERVGPHPCDGSAGVEKILARRRQRLHFGSAKRTWRGRDSVGSRKRGRHGIPKNYADRAPTALPDPIERRLNVGDTSLSNAGTEDGVVNRKRSRDSRSGGCSRRHNDGGFIVSSHSPPFACEQLAEAC